MATRPDPEVPEDPEDRSPDWLGPVKIVSLVLMALMLFWLVRSMVVHHFFSGGQLNLHNGHYP